MYDQMFQTVLGLHFLFASSLALEAFWNWRKKGKILTSHFLFCFAFFLVFSLGFLVR